MKKLGKLGKLFKDQSPIMLAVIGVFFILGFFFGPIVVIIVAFLLGVYE